MRWSLDGAPNPGQPGGHSTTQVLCQLCCMAAQVPHLAIWPVVFGKDGIIGVHRPVGDEHDGLAADASLSCVVELGEETSSN